MHRQTQRAFAYLLSLVLLSTGCAPSRPIYFLEDGDLSHYRGLATDLESPDVDVPSLAEVEGSLPPLTLRNLDAQEIWDLTLEDAVRITLANSNVMRSIGGQVLPTPSRLLSNADFAATAYDPALAESNPLTGVESALAAFDTQFSTSVFWERNERPINISGFFTGFIAPALNQDLGTFNAQLSKTAATGTQFFFRNNTTYEYNNNPSNLFPSVWNTNFEAEIRQPFLQGAGTQFNRIVGPSAQPGLVFRTGVVLARINTDIALADFEINVRNLVADVETAYWELYFAYRNLDAVIVGRDSALQTWRKIHALYVVSARGGEAEKESQAREQYFLFRAQVEDALSQLYTIESRLRYLMGLAATDGRLIRPVDEPTTARVSFDWYQTRAEALVRSAELRRQRWRIEQREMELLAARNFLLPRLDGVARYRWVGFGDDLIDSDSNNPQFDNAFETLTGGDFQEWQLGLQLSMPLGFRRELANVRNAQLQLARERAVLQDQELELSHQLSDAIRNLDRYYTLSQTNFNRRVAAARQVEAVQAAYETETVTLDTLLDAQRRLADAQAAYYRSLVDYNLAIRDVHLRKGSLLEYNGVFLAEGPWPAKAYFDATKRARERDGGIYLDYGFTMPNINSRGPVQQMMHGAPGVYQQSLPVEQQPEEVLTPTPVPEDQLPAVEPAAPMLPDSAAVPQRPVTKLPPIETTVVGTSGSATNRVGAQAVGNQGERFQWGSLGLDSHSRPGGKNLPATAQQVNYEPWKQRAPAYESGSSSPSTATDRTGSEWRQSSHH